MSDPILYESTDIPYLTYINLEISNYQKQEYISKKGEIDTGSPITIIPESMKNHFDLRPMGEKSFGGFNSIAENFPTYYIYVKINSIEFDILEVISQPDNMMPNVLIGRDLINLWKMILDGETHQGSFYTWSTNPVDVSVP